MSLPFLVVYGAWVWKVALVGFVVGVLGAIALIRKLVAHRNAVRAARELDREGLVRGTLGGGGAATLAIDHMGTKTSEHHHRDSELWIETADGRVVLDGDVRVVAGSRMTPRRSRVPKRTPSAIADQSEIYICALRELAVGDRVVARGVVASEPSSEPTDYRDGAPVTVLRAAADAPIALAAVAPRGSAVRLPWLASGLIAAVFAFIGYRIEAGLGNHWRDGCWSDRIGRDELDDSELSNTHPCALANAMPDQPYVLEHLLDRLGRTPAADDDDVAKRFELAHVAVDCPHAISLARALPLPDHLLAEAIRCGDRTAQQLALVRLGEFEAAANLGPFEDRDALVVVTQRWSEAAALATRHADETKTRTDLNDDQKVSVAQHWHCVAELMQWYAGDRQAVARIRELAPGADSACRTELVEMTTGEERDRLLIHSGDREARQRAYEGIHTFDGWRAFELERVLAGEPEEQIESAAGVLARGGGEDHAWQSFMWATMLAPEPTGQPVRAQLAYYDARVVPEVYDGDLAAAHRDVDRAIALDKQLDDHVDHGRELAILHALVDLRSAKLDTAFDNGPAEDRATLSGELQRYLMTGIYLRQGRPFGENALLLTSNKPAIDLAQHGDGSRLVALVTLPLERMETFAVLALLPRITIQRAELVRALRYSPNGWDMLGYKFPWSSLAKIAERRTLFEIGGDREEAAKWAAIYARYRRAVTDRKVLIALALWGNN